MDKKPGPRLCKGRGLETHSCQKMMRGPSLQTWQRNQSVDATTENMNALIHEKVKAVWLVNIMISPNRTPESLQRFLLSRIGINKSPGRWGGCFGVKKDLPFWTCKQESKHSIFCETFLCRHARSLSLLNSKIFQPAMIFVALPTTNWHNAPTRLPPPGLEPGSLGCGPSILTR